MNKKLLIPVGAAAVVFGLTYVFSDEVEVLVDDAGVVLKRKVEQLKNLPVKDLVKEVVGEVVTGTPVLEAVRSVVFQVIGKLATEEEPQTPELAQGEDSAAEKTVEKAPATATV